MCDLTDLNLFDMHQQPVNCVYFRVVSCFMQVDQSVKKTSRRKKTRDRGTPLVKDEQARHHMTPHMHIYSQHCTLKT